MIYMNTVLSSLSRSISTVNSVAMGDSKADLVLKECSLVNVYTREIQKQFQIAIVSDRIAYVGLDASHTIGPNTTIIDLKGKYVTPGFADPHIHIDQFVLPSEFVKKSLLCGTTSLFSDPIDITSVTGYKGFKEFVKLTHGLPIRIFHVVPGGLPVDRKFSHSHSLSISEERSALKLDSVLGLGEVFSWTRVTSRDSKTIKSLSQMLQADCIINGHTAGASGKKLQAYVSSGIFSCHEPINFDQTIERLRLGMWIMIREGSIRRDLKNIIRKVIKHGTYIDRLMFCSDGVDPIDLDKYGHINHCVSESLTAGFDLIDAITLASKNCFDYYNMGKDLGGIAPGKIADILVFDDLNNASDISNLDNKNKPIFKPQHVFVGGKMVVSRGRIVLPKKIKKNSIPLWMKKTVKLPTLTRNDFIVKQKKHNSTTVQTNTISLITEIVTKIGSQELSIQDGNVLASKDKDVWKVAAFDRLFGTGSRTVGFLDNFGADIGAFSCTWSFHENDLIVIGSNETDMAIAANALIRSQGGMAVVNKGKITAHLPLDLAGIISTQTFESTRSNFEKITSVIVDAGSKFSKPYLIPLFLPFLALPSIRITHGGMIDVKNRSIIKPIK